LDLVNKTKKLQQKLDEYSINQTLFPDICEMYSFKKFNKQLKEYYGYSPYEIYKNQLDNLHSKGNDIQLHLHPQWFGANFINGRWILNTHLWRISSSSLDLSYFISKYINFFADEFPHLRLPIVFRAGGYCIQPITKLFQVLKKYNIYYDSSVSINTFKYDSLKYYNFNSRIRSRQWCFERDVLEKNNIGTFTELPIASVNLDNLLKDFVKRIYNNKFSLSRSRKVTWKNSFRRIDFTVMNSSQLIKSILDYVESTDNDYSLILLTGHSKHYNGNNLNFFFDYFKESKLFEFVTLSQYINEIR